MDSRMWLYIELTIFVQHTMFVVSKSTTLSPDNLVVEASDDKEFRVTCGAVWCDSRDQYCSSNLIRPECNSCPDMCARSRVGTDVVSIDRCKEICPVYWRAQLSKEENSHSSTTPAVIVAAIMQTVTRQHTQDTPNFRLVFVISGCMLVVVMLLFGGLVYYFHPYRHTPVSCGGVHHEQSDPPAFINVSPEVDIQQMYHEGEKLRIQHTCIILSSHTTESERSQRTDAATSMTGFCPSSDCRSTNAKINKEIQTDKTPTGMSLEATNRSVHEEKSSSTKPVTDVPLCTWPGLAASTSKDYVRGVAPHDDPEGIHSKRELAITYYGQEYHVGDQKHHVSTPHWVTNLSSEDNTIAEDTLVKSSGSEERVGLMSCQAAHENPPVDCRMSNLDLRADGEFSDEETHYESDSLTLIKHQSSNYN